MRHFIGTMLAAVLCAPGAVANDLTFDGTLSFDRFPDARADVEDRGARLQLGVEGFADLGDVRLSFDIDGYRANYLSEGFVDGVLALSGGEAFRWKAGLLREEWGQPDGTRLNMLVSPNLAFGALSDLDPVAQPGAMLSFDLTDQIVLDIFALAGLRTGPLPEFDERGSFGLPLERDIRAGDLDEGAAALRLSGTSTALDWSVHLFRGLARTPTFVLASPTGIDVVHDDITQVGYELEAAPGDWRVWSEGFWRQDGRDVTGAEVDFGHMTLGAEYQYFAAFNGAVDILVGAELRRDTRGERADQPFQNGVVAGLTVMQNRFQGWEFEYAYLYDTQSEGEGHVLGVTKQLSETPAVDFELNWTTLNAGTPGTVLDAFERDERITTSITWKY